MEYWSVEKLEYWSIGVMEDWLKIAYLFSLLQCSTMALLR
jgi:hypothetical protein